MKFLSLLSIARVAAAIIPLPPQEPLLLNETISDGAAVIPAYDFGSTTQSVLHLHKALVDIPSVSGTEGKIAHWIRDYLESLDYHVHLQELPREDSLTIGSNRFNVLASHKKDFKTPVVLTTHIDTVPPFIPFSRTKDSDGNIILHGRGSNDAKASVAAQIVALTSLLHDKKVSKDDVSLLFVADEEVDGLGMRTANDLPASQSWKAAIFGEPTESKLIAGHKGIVIFSVEATGRAAHSGYPWLGESAVDILIPALVALRAAEIKLPQGEIGNSTLNIGEISGGVAANVVAAHASAQLAIRVGGGTINEIRQIIDNTVKEVDPRIVVKWSGNGYGPVKCDTNIEGFEISTVNYGTDVPNLKLADGSRRYLWGPGSIVSAHSDHEFVAEDELIDAVDGYKRLVLGALKGLGLGD